MFQLGLRHCMQSGRTLILRRSHLMLQKCTITLKTSICREWMALNEEEVGKWWVSLYYGQVIFPMACTILSIYHSTSISFSAVCTDTVSCLSSKSEWISARNFLLARRAWEKWMSLVAILPFRTHSTHSHSVHTGINEWVNGMLKGFPYFPFLNPLCWSWNSNTLATWCEELTPLKRPWCWERLKMGGEGDDRGWDGWMASPTWWTSVWVNSGSCLWTGRLCVLQSMELQRVRHNWVTELNLNWPTEQGWKLQQPPLWP